MRYFALVAASLCVVCLATFATEDTPKKTPTVVEVSFEATVVALYPELQTVALEKQDEVLRQLNGLVITKVLEGGDGQADNLAPEMVLTIVPVVGAQSLWRDAGKRGKTVALKGAVDMLRRHVRVESFTVKDDTDWVKDLQVPGGISTKQQL